MQCGSPGDSRTVTAGRAPPNLEELDIARRFDPRKRDTGKRLRVNDLIRISPIRLIDENNEQVGVVEIDDAKARARDAGLDLVEVAPGSTPPVCRIMDYGKWKYQQRKKEQKAKSHSKQSELKGIRLRPNISEHDLKLKVDHARQFLDEGHKVQFTMIFRGRQMAHRGLAMQKMRDVATGLDDLSKIELEPRMLGRRMTMVVAPDRTGKQATGGGAPSTSPTPPAPPAPSAAPVAPVAPAPPVQEEAPPAA